MSKLTAQTTTKEWQQLGKDDPLFAVASHPDKRGSWSSDEFYELGEQDWADFSRQWRQYAPDVGGLCLEIGSGAGRITKQLVRDFEQVNGIDVSEDMLKLAAKAAPEAKLHQVEDTTIPLADGSVDAIFTCHVLQHLENINEVADYLAEGHRVLRSGGTIMAHLLLEEAPRPLARRALTEAKLRATRLRGANRGVYSRVRLYRPNVVRSAFERAGFRDVELREFRVRSNKSPHSFWLGRR